MVGCVGLGGGSAENLASFLRSRGRRGRVGWYSPGDVQARYIEDDITVV